MNDDDDARISEIRARLEAATPGPWKVQTDSDGDEDSWSVWPWRVITEDETAVLVDFTGGDIPSDEHAALIANAPADIAYLLERVDALTAEIDRLRGRP